MRERQNNEFDLLQEIGRGCLYRGGRDMESFLHGYAWGALLIVLFITGLSMLGVVLGT